LLVVAGAGQRGADLLTEQLDVLVEQREVELELAGKVLVEHRLGHAGAFGDVVHRGGVVAVGDEDLLRGAEQLLAPCRAGQPGRAPAARRRGHGRSVPAVTRPIGEPR
jgi:hypothetical protein